jgi:glycerophosphoryl diester phosphodiesterase
MLIIGHRGAMGHAPENTLLSIRKAIELGADWIEIDVYSVNGQLLVIHDDTVDRTTNGKGPLNAYSFAELRALDAGEGEQIPTLQEVLTTVKGKTGLNIELKGKGSGAAVAKLLSTLPDSEMTSILVSSFQMDELLYVSQFDRSIKIGVLAGNELNSAFEWAHRLGAYSVHLSNKTVTQQLVDQAHRAGLKLYVYTVNETEHMQRLKDMGVDGVFSNFPDRVLSI